MSTSAFSGFDQVSLISARFNAAVPFPTFLYSSVCSSLHSSFQVTLGRHMYYLLISSFFMIIYHVSLYLFIQTLIPARWTTQAIKLILFCYSMIFFPAFYSSSLILPYGYIGLQTRWKNCPSSRTDMSRYPFRSFGILLDGGLSKIILIIVGGFKIPFFDLFHLCSCYSFFSL